MADQEKNQKIEQHEQKLRQRDKQMKIQKA